jgi:hypothetical protein
MLLVSFSGLIIDVISVVAGWSISLLNILAGSYILIKNSDKSSRQFMNVVLGSMVIRIFIIAIMVFIGIQFVGFEEFSFIISLFIFYFIFLTLELKYISRFLK